MNIRGSKHSEVAILVASAVATLAAPILMGWIGTALGGSDLFGGVGLLLLVAFYAPQALLIVFLLTAAAGATLSAFRVAHIVFYSATGSLVGIAGVASLTATAFGGEALVFTMESAVTAAIAGALDGAIYCLVARALSSRRKPS